MKTAHRQLAHEATGFVLIVFAFIASTCVAQPPGDDALLLSQDQDEAASDTRFIADLWLNQDHVSGLPNNRENLDRTRGRLRFGLSGLLGTS